MPCSGARVPFVAVALHADAAIVDDECVVVVAIAKRLYFQ